MPCLRTLLAMVALLVAQPVRVGPRWLVPMPVAGHRPIPEQFPQKVCGSGQPHDGDAHDGHRLKDDSRDPLLLGVGAEVLSLFGDLQQAEVLGIGWVHGRVR